MNLRRKLLARIWAPVRSLFQSITASTYPKAKIDALTRQRCNDPAQWHRWYQANRKRQRQQSALKRMGFRIDPRETGLPRWAVR